MEMTNRIKELIAIGASITANCQPCLQYHADKAAELGATREEIAAAIEVGKCVRKGAGAKMDKFSSAFTPEAAGSCKAEGGGCC